MKECGGSNVLQMFSYLVKQLAHPEHILSAFHAPHFYPTNDSFFQKLKDTILGFPRISQANNYQNFIAKYDWSILAPIYDNRLEKLCQK